MKMKELEKHELRKRTISEVARFIMRYADYSTIDVFRIPLDVMRKLAGEGEIPYSEEEINPPHLEGE